MFILNEVGIMGMYHVALQEWPPHFRQKFEEFEAGASLVRQTYHFNFKGSSLVRANLQGKSQKYFYAENLL